MGGRGGAEVGGREGVRRKGGRKGMRGKGEKKREGGRKGESEGLEGGRSTPLSPL